ncbi:MAG: phenylalanine--tRNA ligase subunit alpha [bacterium]
MKKIIQDFYNSFLREIELSSTPEAVRNIEIKYLGKKSDIQSMLKNIGSIEDPEEKKEMGRIINATKNEMVRILSEKKQFAEQKFIERKISEDRIDWSMPVFSFDEGSLHPITIVRREVEAILTGMGFTVVDGPEMETEYYNFEALNIPKFHPARDMQDTFYLANSMIMRTHTSCCQARSMEKMKPPLKIIAPGKCFRYEALDASHETAFYQIEGLLVDENISIANLIAVMKLVLSEIFKRDVKVRLRPGYFPFVEPGFELDINCLICNGAGCKTCKNSGWLELMPCGMVHPSVLRYGHIDPERYTGFAFGLGLTRLVMMKYGIGDIRFLNSGDLRFLKQFR